MNINYNGSSLVPSPPSLGTIPSTSRKEGLASLGGADPQTITPYFRGHFVSGSGGQGTRLYNYKSAGLEKKGGYSS